MSFEVYLLVCVCSGGGPLYCVEVVRCTVWRWSAVLCGGGPLYCVEVVRCTVWRWSAVLCGGGPLYCVDQYFHWYGDVVMLHCSYKLPLGHSVVILVFMHMAPLTAMASMLPDEALQWLILSSCS